MASANNQHSHFCSCLVDFVKAVKIEEEIPGGILKPSVTKNQGLWKKRKPEGGVHKPISFVSLGLRKLQELINHNEIFFFFLCTTGNHLSAGRVQSHCARVFLLFISRERLGEDVHYHICRRQIL